VSGDEAWPFSSGRVPRAFRAAHHAAKKALKSGEAVRFHEWRKKAKRLLYQLELTRLKPDQYTTRLIKKVDRLQAKLGAYHDCVVAEDTLRYKAPSRADAKRISTLLKKREGRLRKKAQKIARSIPKQPRS
jgi:CHAD domain-containing protein